MLKDEFNRLMQLFRDAAEGKPANMEEVFKEALQFFERLKEHISTGSPEERRIALQMMTQMYQEMMRETKKIAQKAGMTEEQLAVFAENPINFTKEQWEALQNSKGQIKQLGDALVKEIKEGPPPSGSSLSSPKPPEDPKKPKDKQNRQSKWIRS